MKKVELGQFFTRKDWWLNDKKHIQRFINSFDKTVLIDPFAGEGHILNTVKKIIHNKFLEEIKYDIDIIDNSTMYNDSLINIPFYKNGFIVTNPPYLAKNSAKRKQVINSVSHYFENSKWDDLYKIALEKLILSKMPGIAIVPESFINSDFLQNYKNNIDLITIIIPNPFFDTEIPVCVVCFNGKSQRTKIYINSVFKGYLHEMNKKRKIPKYSLDIEFNNINGQIGLRAIDLDDKNKIKFMPKKNFNYPVTNIKNSSRTMTFIKIPDNLNFKISKICKKANKKLKKYRKEVILTPFKGNTKYGKRRRRLDFKTARAILEEVIN